MLRNPLQYATRWRVRSVSGATATVCRRARARHGYIQNAWRACWSTGSPGAVSVSKRTRRPHCWLQHGTSLVLQLSLALSSVSARPRALLDTPTSPSRYWPCSPPPRLQISTWHSSSSSAGVSCSCRDVFSRRKIICNTHFDCSAGIPSAPCNHAPGR